MSGNWIDEQAAEYADLVNDSSFSSATGYVEDDPTEYQLIWEGGDLGVALTTNSSGAGVSVSRITGKGFPHGIKNVVPGDVLLAVNELDTVSLTLEDVVKYLQECDLPATLRLTRPENVTKNVEAKARQALLQTQRPSAYQAPRMSAMSSYKPQRQSFTPPTMANLPTEGVTSPTNAGKPMESRLSIQDRSSAMKKKGIASAYAPRVSTSAAPPQIQQQPAPAAVQAPKPQVVAAAPPKSAAAPPAMPPSILKKPSSVPKSTPPPPPQPVDNKLSIASNLSIDNRASAASNASNATAIAVEDVPQVVQPPVANREYRGESTVSDMAMMDSTEEDTAILDQDEDGGNGSFMEPKIMLVEEEAEDFANEEKESDDDDDDDNYAPLVIPNAPAPPVTSIPTKDNNAQPDAVKPYMPGMGSRDSTLGSSRGTKVLAAPAEPSQPMSTVHEAAAKGDLRGVLTHLRMDKNGPECLLRREPNHGQTPFHLAVKSGNVPLIQMMLDQFAAVASTEELLKIEDDKGNTALHFAATKTPHVVHLLLEAGSPVTSRNSRGLTPLIIAVMTNKKDDIIIVNMLLKFGANPNDVHDATTIIHTAISLKLLKVAGALVRAGAKLDVEDSEGKTVFEKLNRASIKYLVSHIYYPPTFINEKERSECMMCQKKFTFGRRKFNCTHCGRLCCADDASVFIPFVQFPQGFPGRIHKGHGVLDEKRCCKTCYNVLKERAAAAAPPKPEKGFVARVIGVEWDEVNPDKLQQIQSAGRRRG
ncbi:unnamed protein product [Aphanomyces euteiches]|uniref:FYVE-type domain-containing protein n=1 Tax=Aphanomyces euteiches TaxID=100861 RepID=A0A6G0X0P7_9STRA|nr:hypothetical protein Ae201684_009696 [Aphanomyces euteiches]KAH9085332.1 hypothetical protein Ae201684P_005041 [Aphanomyces euteiches]